LGGGVILKDMIITHLRMHIAPKFATIPLNGGSPHPEQPNAMADLKSAMRANLGIVVG
jgi:hypothetical protein